MSTSGDRYPGVPAKPIGVHQNRLYISMAVTSLVGRQSSCIIPRVDACRLLCRPRPAFIDFSSSSSPVCLTQSKNTIGRSSQAIYPSKVVDNLQSYSSSLSCSPHCNLVSKSIPALDPLRVAEYKHGRRRGLTKPGLLLSLDFNGQSEISQLDGGSFCFAGQQQVFRLVE